MTHPSEDDGEATLAKGGEAATLRAGWRSAQAGIRRRDTAMVEAARDVARTLVDSPRRRIADDAKRLESFCAAVLDGVGGGVDAPGVVDRLLRRDRGQTPRRNCPYCAERIALEARLCRFCGKSVDPDERGVDPS